MTDEPQVLVNVADGVGRLTLNRPRVLNALNAGMVDTLTEVLQGWVGDSEVSVVVLDGAGERGLCAGGDIRELAENTAAGKHAGARAFFRAEYRLNALIAEYPKPVVALMDGITMGGGIGLAGHAAIRIVTERSRLAMPETRIGFTPDVGGSWLLARAPGELGTYLALNSASMAAADAIDTGFADFYLPSELLPHLLQALAERADPGSPAEIAMLFDETPEPLVADGETVQSLRSRREWIDACYSADTVPAILERLRARPEQAAHRAADELEQLSPTALSVTLATLRAARELPSLRDALEQEYGVGSWLLEQQDFAEGVRALLIDRDRSPRWQPATLAELPADAAASALAHRPAEPLW
ncbi:enoyl-CoA hydratase/isomerase family protein [Microterricola viridarii]|uniref:3-hydroxyisobutyryl-CoA hydrolase n=1 Tax=Microterricola viridarii TaxID=412690 RepID=A0A0Y0PBM4_9MICO|nr:enoyl-CoA hydratase/isomerase family protein [Microterricola viridarii]AMB59947.1 3-hydroxyisobutyryl-CoA hydrolase [Microterricola viridarii]